jgi:putative NADH-flavin reductase
MPSKSSHLIYPVLNKHTSGHKTQENFSTSRYVRNKISCNRRCKNFEKRNKKGLTSSQASGHLGPHVLKALIEANFQVTVLTRSKKLGAYDAVIRVIEVDFTSVESLTVALKGIDAVVSTVGNDALGNQTVLIDAAIAAGVKRFIPSEYGSCTTNPKLEAMPVYAPMFKIRQYLQEKASAGKLTWTVLACGAFLDFLFGGPALLDFANHKATLYDEGDNRISSTSMPNVGKAIAGILKNYDATKNKIVRTSEVILTQNELLEIAEGLRPDIKWELSKVSTSVLLREGLNGASTGDFSMPVIMKVLTGTALAGDTYGSAYDETDNDLLGVKELTKEESKNLVAGKLA